MLMQKQKTKGDFPAEYGKILGVGYNLDGRATCIPTTTYNDWQYCWSIHFENGTLPVIVGKDADSAVIDLNLFEYDTNALFNSADYLSKKSKWRNAYGRDVNTTYYWYRYSSTGQASIQYSVAMSTAAKWGWNNGTYSVYTDIFTFDVQNNGKVLVVTKNGTFFGRYTVSG